MGHASNDIDRAASALVTLFAPHLEVVLHDLKTQRVVRIWNPISGRQVGDDSLVDPALTSNLGSEVLGPYEQVDIRGHTTSSVSVAVDSGANLLCINFDRSALNGAVAVLAALGAARSEQPVALFSGDWRAHINELIADWCVSHSLVARDLDRAARAALVSHLDRHGAFTTRHAAVHVATALGVSRATVYNLRKKVSS